MSNELSRSARAFVLASAAGITAVVFWSISALFTSAFAAVGTVQLAVVRTADPAVERGRYLVRVGGCNDRHTPLVVFEPQRAARTASAF